MSVLVCLCDFVFTFVLRYLSWLVLFVYCCRLLAVVGFCVLVGLRWWFVIVRLDTLCFGMCDCGFVGWILFAD